MSQPGGLPYQIEELRKDLQRQSAQLEDLQRSQAKQGETLVRLEPLPARVAGLSRAAWWLGALIVASSVGFAFSVLALIP